jgi:hypothetical protein
MRHDRIDTVISGANPISVTEAACERGPCPRRVPTRSREPARFERHDLEKREVVFRGDHADQGSDDGSLADASCGKALTWEMVRRECGRRPIEKARGRFPGAGFKKCCDDGAMPVICPTCQIFLWSRRSRAGASTQIPAPGARFLRL